MIRKRFGVDGPSAHLATGFDVGFGNCPPCDVLLYGYDAAAAGTPIVLPIVFFTVITYCTVIALRGKTDWCFQNATRPPTDGRAYASDLVCGTRVGRRRQIRHRLGVCDQSRESRCRPPGFGRSGSAATDVF